MGVEIYIIRLIRKIIRDIGDEQNGKKDIQGDFFATDYFDVVEAEKIDDLFSITDIMGIWPNEKLDVRDVTVQSYSLYCGTEMLKIEKGKEKCGNPFIGGERGKQLPFLSIIQIHITPEAIAHGSSDKEPNEFIEMVFLDIHVTIQEFIKANPEISLIFRVYKMLSAGDFAIVLRSVNAETSFQISTFLRCRTLAKSTEFESKDLVLYKTYTLLTLDNNIILSEEENGKDKFALRCCYSNLYWSNKEQIDKLFNSEQLKSLHLYGLNGRYDFGVHITEKEFLELFPYIKAYKENGSVSIDEIICSKNHESPVNIVQYIKYLITNNYLSYINERFLVTSDRNENKLLFKRSKIKFDKPIQDRKRFMDYIINSLYSNVLKKYNKVWLQISEIRCYRKNMLHNMNLLEKLIKLCYGINGFSDTRIYAAVLLEQLDVIIDSIEIYIQFYMEFNKDEYILDLLEDYIREAVCVLDGYAKYIRNNNLQSLQAPNYNIESNVSMEKILIGYSEFLKVFIEFYREKQQELDNSESRYSYLPIVVPVLSKRDMSVEVLFPEGIMEDWKKEEKYKDRRYCMVISVPTLAELGDIHTLITVLFHEVAHQFRYETRSKRNDTLLYYNVHTIMNDIVIKLIQKIKEDMGYYGSNDKFRELEKNLTSYFIISYFNVNYDIEDDKLQYSYQDVPLNNFVTCFLNSMRDSLGYWGTEEQSWCILKGFIRKLFFWYNSEEGTCLNVIEKIEKLFKEIMKENEKEKQKKLINQFQKSVFVFTFECACQVCGKTERIWGKSFENWIINEESIDFFLEWNKFFNKNIGKKDVLNEIWNVFYEFECWCSDKIFKEVQQIDIKKRDLFLEKAYALICENWKKEIEKIGKDIDFCNNLIAIGRILGVDCNTKNNLRIFKREVCSIIDSYIDDEIEIIKWQTNKYREETADIFMCNAMKLTPFGYMNTLAVNWPDSLQLSNEHIFQWCVQDNELKYDKFRGISVQIVKEIVLSIRLVVKRHNGDLDNEILKRILNKLEVKIEWEDDTEENALILCERLKELVEICWLVWKEISEDKLLEREIEMLRLCRNTLSMLEQIVVRARGWIDYFYDYTELKDDYMEGVKYLRNLNKEICESKHKIIKYLGSFLEVISLQQNKPYLLIKDVKRCREINEESIEFLLTMYYANKRRIAKEIGGKEDIV